MSRCANVLVGRLLLLGHRDSHWMWSSTANKGGPLGTTAPLESNHGQDRIVIGRMECEVVEVECG